MCLIIVKKAGMELPDEGILEASWNNNPDGAGFMYSNGKDVVINKGFMKYKEFKKAINGIKNVKDLNMIIHFRITTHGGTSKSNTHPFPITSNMKEIRMLDVNTRLGLAHNGTINISNDKGLSDTMQFILDELSLFNSIKPTWYKDIKSLEYIENRIGSKLAIMDSRGYIATVGEFYEDDGILYSNYSYMEYTNYYNYDYGNNYGISSGSMYSKEEELLLDRLESLGLQRFESEAIFWELPMEELLAVMEIGDKDYMLDIIYS